MAVYSRTRLLVFPYFNNVLVPRTLKVRLENA